MNTLLPLYREMAAGGGNFHGLSLLNHRADLQKLIHTLKARSVLDFGCGRGDPYRSPHKIWREWGLKWFDIWLYDPAFPTHDRLPPDFREFDLVICSDVLEHVPEADVDAFIKNLFVRARKHVWASVCCRPAKKFFPDGVTNLHVTVRPYQWWLDTFNELSNGTPFTLVETL